jgi:hypothetical protein
MPAFALNKREDRLLVEGANDSVVFIMSDLITAYNDDQVFAKRSAIRDLPPGGLANPWRTVLSFGSGNASFPQVAAMGLVCVHFLLERLMDHLQIAGDPFGAALQPQQQGFSKLLYARFHHVCIAAALGAQLPYHRLALDCTRESRYCSSARGGDSGIVMPNQAGDLRDAVQGYDETGTLLTFDLAEMFWIHWAATTCRAGILECQTYLGSFPPLVNVVLRA